MHIREVSEHAGVSVALVKFYVREGLLHPGERRSANDTSYDDTHVARLRLIRALVEGGRVSLAGVRSLLAVVDDDAQPIGAVLSDAYRALAPIATEPSEASLERVRRYVAEHGWVVSDDNPGIAQCAVVLDAVAELGRADMVPLLDRYADAIYRVAQVDASVLRDAPEDRAAVAETIVLGSVLGDAALLSLRRLAFEDAERRSRGDLDAGPLASADGPGASSASGASSVPGAPD